MKRQRARDLLLGLVLCLGLAGFACEDFERNAWVTIRDADAAIESATSDWEEWRAEEPPQFTQAELEKIRQVLATANEALSIAEVSFTTYRTVKAVVDAGGTGDLEGAKADLQEALKAVTRAVQSVRAIIQEASARRESPPAGQARDRTPPLRTAGVGFGLIAALLGLAADFVRQLKLGKKGAISAAAVDLIAAVMQAHKQATGEDIDLALPRLRKRIADRRRRLARA